jgi:hypothetical protein
MTKYRDLLEYAAMFLGFALCCFEEGIPLHSDKGNYALIKTVQDASFSL